jgi:hypothetical protein
MSLYLKSFWTLQRCDRRTEASRMGYGYTAALINFAFVAHAVWTTGRSRQGDGARFIKLGQTHGHY